MENENKPTLEQRVAKLEAENTEVKTYLRHVSLSLSARSEALRTALVVLLRIDNPNPKFCEEIQKSLSALLTDTADRPQQVFEAELTKVMNGLVEAAGGVLPPPKQKS